jgi:hypothetical protein
MAPINQLSTVDMGEANDPDPVITHNGVEVLKYLFGDHI